jgi:hypothetical protein
MLERGTLSARRRIRLITGRLQGGMKMLARGAALAPSGIF